MHTAVKDDRKAVPTRGPPGSALASTVVQPFYAHAAGVLPWAIWLMKAIKWHSTIVFGKLFTNPDCPPAGGPP